MNVHMTKTVIPKPLKRVKIAIWVTISDTYFISKVELWNDDSYATNDSIIFKSFIRKGSLNGGNHLLLSIVDLFEWKARSMNQLFMLEKL